MAITKEEKPVSTPIVGSRFFYFRDVIEQELARCISRFGEKTKLRDACEYALTNGGKRFRPLIVMMVADALGKGINVTQAALSVEFFHTASLIADDLPCMDNDDERRDKPTTHKVFGETVALLASYALITAGFEAIYRNTAYLRDFSPSFSKRADHIGMLALESASVCSGILGATGGQFYDVFPPTPSLDVVKDVIYKKTVTLFEVSFVFGWLFGGGDIELLEKVKDTAYYLGMAFQIADDLGDLEQDEGKEKEISMARLIGKERALALFTTEMDSFRKNLEELGIYTPSFQKMSDMLHARAAHFVS